MEIFIVKNWKQSGPHSIEEIQKLISEGGLLPEDYAWHDGLKNWTHLSALSSVPFIWPRADAHEAAKITQTGPNAGFQPPPLPGRLGIAPESVLAQPPVEHVQKPADYSAAIIQALAIILKTISASKIHAYPNISEEALSCHKREYLNLAQGEQALVLLNGSKLELALSLGQWSGLAVTNLGIHYCVRPNGSFFAFGKRPKAYVPFEQIRTIEIGKEITGFNGAYLGHQLRINGDTVGLVIARSGFFGKKEVKFLNSLFNMLYEKGLLEEPVEES